MLSATAPWLLGPSAEASDGEQDQARTLRIDKWLWAARFYKTRSIAADEIGKGRVSVNQQTAKAARDLRPGDVVEVRRGDITQTVTVMALSDVRGPAPIAQLLYAETADSVARREAAAKLRREGVEPSHAIEHGRPTKRDRRQLADWNRWSATLDRD